MTNEFRPKDIYNWTEEEWAEGHRYAKSIGMSFLDWTETFMPTNSETLLASMRARAGKRHRFDLETRKRMASDIDKLYDEKIADLSEEEFLKAFEAHLNGVK